MASHLDELVAAVGVLAGQEFVDAHRIVGLGNSEGTLHVLHFATTAQAVPFCGLVLAEPPGRAIGDVLMTQLALQAAQGMDNVTFVFPPNANHVLKEDTRTPAEVAAAPGSGYNDDGTRLDPEALGAILSWLGKLYG